MPMHDERHPDVEQRPARIRHESICRSKIHKAPWELGKKVHQAFPIVSYQEMEEGLIGFGSKNMRRRRGRVHELVMGDGWEARVAVSRPVVRSHPGPHALIQDGFYATHMVTLLLHSFSLIATRSG